MRQPSPISDQPRISSNQLGEYVFATPAKRARILRDQKFGNAFRSPYYQSAQSSVLGAFKAGDYDTTVLRDKAAQLRSKEAKNRNQFARFNNNAEMIRRFCDIAGAARPPTGEHSFIRQGASIDVSGVVVSVRPEIATVCSAKRSFCYTKFRFSKSKVSEDESEIVLLLLLKYGGAQASEMQRFDPDATRLVDCFSRNVIEGHRLARIRETQLETALREIRRLWPTILS
ncbi:MAG TPA: hypothetical protein VG734_17995 [Lacunisphaera sp.]|nr:hypothetical protein [Lacunisphaera sp.]